MTIEKMLEIIKSEGDSKTFKYKGYTCHILRHPAYKTEKMPGFLSLFHLCGYVELPSSHKHYKKSYDDIDVDVHGGLTFANDHLPGKQPTDKWVIGFDCAHAGDLSMIIPSFSKLRLGERYRTMEWVKKELKSLVDQL